MNLNLLDQSELLKGLDWHRIISSITEKIHFEKNKQTFGEQLRPLPSDQLREQYERHHAFLQLIDKGQAPLLTNSIALLPSQSAIEQSLGLLAKEGVLQLEEIHEIATHVEVFGTLTQHLRREILPFLIDQNHLQQLNRLIAREIRPLIASDGSLQPDGHPELAQLAQKLTSVEKAIRARIHQILNDPHWSDVLQFSSFDIIADHYVLPIKSNSYRASYGRIIHNSDSGATLFVEPYILREMGRERNEILAQMDEIILKICRNFSLQLHTHLDIIQLIRASLHYFDLEMAKAQFTQSNNFTIPQIANQPTLILQGFYHPLIANAVCNDFELQPSQHGFIISGPNTGGKSVLLKSIALAHLFLYLGVGLPAAHAVLYPFDAIFYFSEDQQNLEHGLSSFSAEVANYLNVLNSKYRSKLIFFDEIFNSTSSEEASALAFALFDAFLAQEQTYILASTHHSHLKMLTHSDPRYLSSHMNFNLENKRPTYQLISGTPGPSFALEIFHNLSERYLHDPTLLQKAYALLDPRTLNFEKIVSSIKVKEESLEQLLNENKKLKHTLKQKLNTIEFDSKKQFDQLYAERAQELKRTLAELKQLMETIRLSKREVDDFNRQRNQVQASLDRLEKQSTQPLQPLATPNIPPVPAHAHSFQLKIGESYHSTSLDYLVKLQKINERKKSATVWANSYQVELPLADLRPPPPQTSKAKRPRPAQFHYTVTAATGSGDNNAPTSLQFDCRGYKLSEFSELLDKICDDLILERIPFAIVIHGHGGGVLKRYLREYLAKHSEFTSSAVQDHDDGATHIALS